MINHNKFAKLDYVVLPTTKNPAYKTSRYSWIVFIVVIIGLTCINF